MTAKDAPRAESAAADSTSAVIALAVTAAARLRGALEMAEFDVERDFTSWKVVSGTQGADGIEIGDLSLATANRLWALLERCGGARLSARTACAELGRRAPRRREGHAPEEARRSAARLRATLKRAGFDLTRDFACCVADRTASGMGLVRLGTVSTATADMLSALIEALFNSAPAQPRGGSVG